MSELKRAFFYFSASILLMFAVVIAFGTFAFITNGRRAHEGQEAHDKICALAQEYVFRISNTKEFLRDRPAGIPGVPVKAIKADLKNEEKTFDILKGGCDLKYPNGFSRSSK